MITREADYAVRILLYLAGQDADALVSSAVLAQAMDVPYSFLRLIVQKLVGAKLIESRRGKTGGIRLLIPCNKISLKTILYILDAEGVTLNACITDKNNCGRSRHCTVHRKLKQIQAKLDKELQSVTLDQLG